ncbi:MAG: AAA family ATPase [Planctomycetota bacterium]
MPDPDATIASLRKALDATPTNAVLRGHLAQTLLDADRAEEAESEFRRASADDPTDPMLKLGLASAFVAQKKQSQAMVLLESITKGDDALPAGRVLLAKLLLAEGKADDAEHHYKIAIREDASVADKELSKELGIRPQFGPHDPDEFDYLMAQSSSGAGFTTGDMDEDEEDIPFENVERPSIKFDDVGGLEDVKEQVRMKIIHPLEHAELYQAYGKKLGGGILLYGPPGCGKTHLARATAGEIDRRFISVGISDVLDMWVGNSEKNLHALFERARRNKPCVLFFDEVDALAASRQDMRQSAGRHLINQFLAELDGADHDNDGLLVLAATNAPWHVDPAFRRPGRFDRVVFVPPPDAPARAAILEAMLKDKPTHDVDLAKVAKSAVDLSGADLKAVVDAAVEAKLADAMKTGKPEPIGTKDLLRALKQVRPSTREWFDTAKNHVLYANQGGAYDDVAKFLKL